MLRRIPFVYICVSVCMRFDCCESFANDCRIKFMANLGHALQRYTIYCGDYERYEVMELCVQWFLLHVFHLYIFLFGTALVLHAQN